jgi:hypothetical protein
MNSGGRGGGGSGGVGGGGGGNAGGGGGGVTIRRSDVISQRDNEIKQWSHDSPTVIDPNNMNMKVFNDIFEKVHMPDPDSDGYGDWLKTGDSAGGGGGGAGGAGGVGGVSQRIRD